MFFKNNDASGEFFEHAKYASHAGTCSELFFEGNINMFNEKKITLMLGKFIVTCDDLRV